jgi:hypothetical protein
MFFAPRAGLGSILLVTFLTGCATVRHPVEYSEGRPEWTYDLSRLASEELPAGIGPDTHQLFLGIESTETDTEEAARMGALLNAQQQAKMYLHSYGVVALQHKLSKSADSEQMRFSALLDETANAELAQFQAVQWYIEEHRYFPYWPFASRDTRHSGWRAWCITAIPKQTCERIVNDALKRFEGIIIVRPGEKVQGQGQTSMNSGSDAGGPGSPSLEATVAPPSKTYGQRAGEGFFRGIANVLCAPLEILNQPFVLSEAHERDGELLQLVGFIEGIPVGFIVGGLRLVYGAGSLVLAPFGTEMFPIVHPPLPDFAFPVA